MYAKYIYLKFIFNNQIQYIHKYNSINKKSYSFSIASLKKEFKKRIKKIKKKLKKV